MPVSGLIAVSSKCYESRHENNFGALRLLFSLLVLFSHSYPLSNGLELDPLGGLTSGKLGCGSLAVDGFFLISGCLITQSWIRSQSAATFLIHRILRIYPGYLVALVFSLIVGIFASEPTTKDYLRQLYHDDDRGLQAVLFLEYGWLEWPQTFTTNPYPGVVNGSLWTLQPELKCYALTLALGCFGLIGKKRATWLLTFVVYAAYVMNWSVLGGTNQKLIRFFTFFLLGASVTTEVLPRISMTPLKLVVSLTIIGAASAMKSRVPFTLVLPPVFAYLLFGIAYCRITPGATFFAKYDLSYGVYLYAFPIQQSAVRLLGLESPIGLFVVALPITVTCAYASWNFIERPFIARSRGSTMLGKSVRPAAPTIAGTQIVSIVTKQS